MSKRTKPPFRADHVGSLLRPQRLHDARAQFGDGKMDRAALTAIEDECITEAVKLQEEAGLQSITDGEFRRRSWHYDFLTQLENIELTAAPQGPAFSGGYNVQSLVVKGKVSNPNGVMLDHFEFLKGATSKTPKFCIPSPSLAYHRGGRALIDEKAYPDIDEFWADLAKAYQDEIQLLADRGCTYLQLDDTTFAMLCDPRVREQMKARGDDADQLIATYAKGIGDAIKSRPDSMAVTVHMCRGNFKSTWIAEGGYEPVAERMFADTPVDGFFMEWDSDRAGGFEPLKYAGKNQVIVLGLVTSKEASLETKDDLKRRIEEASKYVALENLCLSPQCGFASTVDGNDLTIDDERRKLALVVEVADEVWGTA